MKESVYMLVSTWALDFCTAFLARPKILQWVAKIAMGRWAYRELYGMKKVLEDDGFVLNDGYELKGCDYHNDKVEIG